MDITELLAFANENGASDIHVKSGSVPRLRISGNMVPVKVESLTDEEVRESIYDIMSDDQRKAFEEHLELDFSFAMGDVARFRVNVFVQQNGMSAVFRIIPTEILSLEQLGAPEIFKQIAMMPRGLCLVTGPTGSGKSTTMAAMIDYYNANEAGHILTVEDPIEFVHQDKQSIVSQRELGPHTKSFKNALKAALREDPDIILVGEMRDLETISLALSAAETGHMVFGTLHTSSAPKTIDRIIDVFPSSEQEMVRAMLSESLRAVISQTLLKKAGGGRIAAHEIMLGTPAIKNLIREGKIAGMISAMQTGKSEGMQTLDSCLIDLLKSRKITRDEALKKCFNKKAFEGV